MQEVSNAFGKAVKDENKTPKVPQQNQAKKFVNSHNLDKYKSNPCRLAFVSYLIDNYNELSADDIAISAKLVE